MNRLIAILAPLVLVILLPACAHGPAPGGEANPYNSVSVGSELVLHRPLFIPGNEVAVFLQDGRVVPRSEVDLYYPNCKFEVRTIGETTRSVEPDTFVIRRVTDEMLEVSAGHPLYASTAAFGILGMGDGPQIYNYTTTMYLESARQPDVFRIACRHVDDAWRNRYVSIQEMRETLGGIFTLKLAEPVD